MVRKVSREIVNRTIDKLTGEIMSSSSTHTVRVQQEEVYGKIYQKAIKEHAFTKSEFQVFLACIWKMDYDGLIKLTPGDRERMVVSPYVWRKGIKRLITSHFIIKLNNYEYLVNPHIIAKGTWDSIKILRQQWAEAESNGYQIKAIDLIQTHPNMKFKGWQKEEPDARTKRQLKDMEDSKDA